MAEPDFTPVPPPERLASLDILRALALFGVLWMNLGSFSGATALRAMGEPVGGGGLDAWVQGIGQVLVRGKALSCFSMLFGIGLSMQLERFQAREQAPGSFARRRLGGLFLLGFLHSVLLWNGDILAAYALAGGLLLLLRKAPARSFLLLGLLAVLVSDGLSLLVQGLGLPVGLDYSRTIGGILRTEAATFGSGTLGAAVQLRLSKWADWELPANLLASLPYALPMFLTGAQLWKRGLVREPGRLRRLFHATFWAGLLGSFLAMDPLHRVPEGWKEALEGAPWLAFTDLATYSLAVGYLAGLLRLLAAPAWTRRLAFLAPLGRTALTHYLGQSLVFTWLFYGHGLGLWGKVGPAGALGLAVAGIILQLALSHLWLARFRFGPAEWLWRSLTYGSWQPFRRDRKPDAAQSRV